jgi:hypothetical protein
MYPIRDFVAGLARVGKSFKEIHSDTEAAYGENWLKTKIYEIIRAVKEGKATVDQWQQNRRRKRRSLLR